MARCPPIVRLLPALSNALARQQGLCAVEPRVRQQQQEFFAADAPDRVERARVLAQPFFGIEQADGDRAVVQELGQLWCGVGEIAPRRAKAPAK